jgi:predicted N-formylglutamate amidohydrolase
MALDSAGDTSLLLGSAEVPPVLEHNAAGRSPFLLTCDHYGRLIPRILSDLGLPERELTRHIAWDIGIAGVAEALSKHLDAHLIAQLYSRLVIDCNRPPGTPSSIPQISDATTIRGNEDLAPDAAEARRRQIFDPYHRRIAEVIDQRLRDGIATVLVSLHSFTPVYAGVTRPWHIGTLYHRDTRLPPLLLKWLRAQSDLVVGDNEPYAVSNETDYTIPVHGEARGLMNSGIEIRQDLIADQAGQKQWADRLANVFGEIEIELRAQRQLRFKAFRCPCCKFKTLYGRGQDEICPVCFWHDDGQDEADAERVLGGPNRDLSLRQAQINFKRIGAIDERWKSKVRRPEPDEA